MGKAGVDYKLLDIFCIDLYGRLNHINGVNS